MRVSPTTKTIRDILLLLGSGWISALFFVLLLSNRLSTLPTKLTVDLNLFVQWQVIGLTVCKCGLDQLVFARCSASYDTRYDRHGFFKRPIIALLVIYGLIVARFMGSFIALNIVISLFFDIQSLVEMAELNARRRFLRSSFSNYLNYPLFCILIIAVVPFAKPTIHLLAILFVSTSIARWIYLRHFTIRKTRRSDTKTAFSDEELVHMGFQQSLNYLMFRFDIVLVTACAAMFALRDVRSYLFLVKYVDIISGLAVVIGTVVFPQVFDNLKFAAPIKGIRKPIYLLYIAGYAALNIAMLTAYVLIWKGPDRPYALMVPFYSQTLLMLGANYVTYCLLRLHHLRELLTIQGMSVLSGLPILSTGLLARNTFVISWTISLQLSVFIIVAIHRNRGVFHAFAGSSDPEMIRNPD